MKEQYRSRVYTDRPAAVDDLEKIQPYEPNVVKAAWNIFGKSYDYRKKYNEYKAKRMSEAKQAKVSASTQMSFEDLEESR